jgi:hypothetical protein
MTTARLPEQIDIRWTEALDAGDVAAMLDLHEVDAVLVHLNGDDFIRADSGRRDTAGRHDRPREVTTVRRRTREMITALRAHVGEHPAHSAPESLLHVGTVCVMFAAR